MKTSKKCSKCKILKPIKEFYKDVSSPDLHTCSCRVCQKKYTDSRTKERREYYLNNIEKIKIDRLEYIDRNREKISKNKKRYYLENKEMFKDLNRKYLASKRGKISRAISNGKRKAKKISSDDGSVTTESLKNLIDIQDNKCNVCKCELDFKAKNKVHLDHYIPLSKGGVHSISNVVYLCRDCNLSKKDKHPTTLLLI